MAEHTKIVPTGTVVRYHGSLRHYHGEMVVHDFHREMVDTAGQYSPVRYILVYGSKPGDYLQNVRPESFTVVEGVVSFDG
jgi:hypothetical protein